MTGYGTGFMKGATDGGKHIEGMRQSGMKAGRCELQATGCEHYSMHLEFHHEKYKPERGIYVCHHCHHLAHFRPWSLTIHQKNILIRARHGDVAWGALQRRPRVVEMMRKNYVAPGRRPAQMKVRAEVRRRAKERR